MSKVNTFRRVFLRVLAILILAPATLAAAMVTLVLYGSAEYRFFSREDSLATYEINEFVIAGICTLLGWIGIVTAWRLYSHFIRSSHSPAWTVWAWIGLLCGSVACAVLVHTSAGTLVPKLYALGWPLLGSIGLGGVLLTAERSAQVNP